MNEHIPVVELCFGDVLVPECATIISDGALEQPDGFFTARVLEVDGRRALYDWMPNDVVEVSRR